MSNTQILLSIIDSVKQGDFDAAHDDAYYLPTKVGRKIQLAIQTGRTSDALCIADRALGNI